MKIKNGALLLFRLFGVNVYVHWLWVAVAAVPIYLMSGRGVLFNGHAHAMGYYVAIYLSLFTIVLIHEFGHALACKSVGGRAEEIVLWPLGGVAYVQPPQRPGPFLWSIAAGPLVNVLFLPLTLVPAVLLTAVAPASLLRDYVVDLAWLNASLLIFNMLPFYPLDGGQILRSLLWFLMGAGRSLLVASIVGVVGAVLLGLLAVVGGGLWLGLMALFMGSMSLRSMRSGRLLLQLEKAPRRPEVKCPRCGQHPPHLAAWRCRCGMTFDTFRESAVCPACRQECPRIDCPYCHEPSLLAEWYATPESGGPVHVAAVSVGPAA